MRRITHYRALALFALALSLRAGAAEKADRFAQWEKEISAFEQADKANPPPQDAILFIGSSGIRLWKTLDKDFPEHRVINRGFGGSQIVDSTHFADRIIFPCRPRMIVLRAGSNDLNAGKSPEEVFNDFKAFVARISDRLPNTRIVYVGMNPTLARWKQHEREIAVNTLIADFARVEPRVRFVDTYNHFLDDDGKPRADLLAEDKLHFSAAGYKVLANLIRPQLAR